MTEEKLLRISVGVLVAISPFLLWLVLYIANRRSQEDLRAQISRLKKLRWIYYIAGVAFWLACLIDHRFSRYWTFGTVLIASSVALEIPASHLKKRLARFGAEENSSPLPSGS